MTPDRFIAELSEISLPSTFNPYVECCPIYDRADAAKRRRANLRKFLKGALAARAETIWIARDLGYRGGRRTGVPLTDEVHLGAMGDMFDGMSLSRATRGPVVAERTAAIVWQVIRAVRRPLFLWNVFPFHPFERDDPMSNRCHSRAERLATKHILVGLLEMLDPKRIVAIGRDAQAALAELDIAATAVRHPSYGGQSEFIAGLADIYGLQSRQLKAA